MANLIKSVLGRPTGAVGDIVFRQMDGKTIVATRPGSFMPGIDEASVDRRSKFRFAVKLASAANGMDDIREIWDQNVDAGSPFQNLVKTNYPYVDADGLPGSYKLTPAGGFGTSTSLITVSPVAIEAELNPLGDNIGIDTAEEVSIRLLSLVYLYNPTDPNCPAYDFLVKASEDIPLQLASAVIFSVPLMNQDTEKYNLYQNRSVYFAVVTLDAEGNVVHFSTTFRNV